MNEFTINLPDGEYTFSFDSDTEAVFHGGNCLVDFSTGADPSTLEVIEGEVINGSMPEGEAMVEWLEQLFKLE